MNARGGERSPDTVDLTSADADAAAAHDEAARAAKAALHASEERYRSVVAAMGEGVIVQDATGAIVDCNPSAERILRLTADQMMGRTPSDPRWGPIHEDGSPFPGPTHPTMVTLETGEPCIDVIMGVHRGDGTLIWVSINTEPLFRPGEEKPYQVVTTFTDLRKAQEALRASEARYRELANSLADQVFAVDRDTRYTFWNTESERATGIGAADAIGRRMDEVFPEIAGTEVERAVLEVLETGEPRSLVQEFPLQGDSLWFGVRISPTSDGAAFVSRDITETKRAELALRESEARFRLLAENASDMVFRSTPEAVLEWVSPSCAGVLGWTPEQMVGRSIMSFIHLDDLTRVRGESAALNRTGGTAFEARYRCSDGTYRWLSIVAHALMDADGNVVARIGSGRDVQAEHEALGMLRQRDSELAEAQRIAHVGSWSYDPATGAVGWSEEMFQIFGLDPAGPAPSFVEQARFVDRETYDRAVAAVDRATERGEPFGLEMELRRADGGVRHVVARGEPVSDAHGTVIAVRGSFADITELRDTQTRLEQARRAEFLGRIVGGVAHDFNNVLAAMNGYAELLAASIPMDDPRRADVDALIAAGARGAALTRRLLAFGRPRESRPTVVDIDDVIAGIASMLRSLAGVGVEVILEPAPEPALVEIDPDRFEQAIVNLVVNARDAMPDGGRLTIGTELVTLQAGDPDLRQPNEPGAYVRMSVSDTGTGMDEATKARIFEPFFTTKPTGSGTGLGLMGVEATVAAAGGFVTVRSEVGRGSTLAVTLPASRGLATARPTDGTPPSMPDRGPSTPGRTILVVDDEPDVRAIAVRILRAAGYAVLEASDPEIALAICDRASIRLDAMLTDVVMPGMDGRELAREVAARRPGIAIAFMTAHAPAVPGTPPGASASAAAAVDAGTFADLPGIVLAKPFTGDELRRTMRALLAGKEMEPAAGAESD